MVGLEMRKQEKWPSVTREVPVYYVPTEDAFSRSKTCNFIVVDFNLDFDHAPINLTVKTKENSNKQHNILSTTVIKTTTVSLNTDSVDEIKNN